MISTICLYRCVGKINGRIIYRINVAAHVHSDAIYTCKKWEEEKDGKQDATWEAYRQTVTGPLYILDEEG